MNKNISLNNKAVGLYLACSFLATAIMLTSVNAVAGDKQPLSATQIIDQSGHTIGQVSAQQARGGVLLKMKIKFLSPGPHGVHLHTKGNCSALPSFKSAGGHLASHKSTHGFHHSGDGTPSAQHMGDLPNIHVAQDGTAKVDFFTSFISMEDLLDGDGTAVIIHETFDDYTDGPSGNSGKRIACAAFLKPQTTAPTPSRKEKQP